MVSLVPNASWSAVVLRMLFIQSLGAKGQRLDGVKEGRKVEKMSFGGSTTPSIITRLNVMGSHLPRI